jgi:hypothetical protein
VRLPIADFVDRIFYVNLDSRLDRRAHIEAELEKHGLTSMSERIPGVVYTGEIPPWFGGREREKRGAMGCAIAHLHVFRRAEALGLKRFLVLEDDAIFTHPEDLPDFLSELPDDWSLAYLNHGRIDEPKPFTKHVERILGQLCTFAYMVDQRVLPALLQRCDPLMERPRHPKSYGGIIDRVLLKEMYDVVVVRPAGRPIVEHRYDLPSSIS